MTPYRQLIRPGQHGKDVTAVKRGMHKMKAPGYESLSPDDHAGTAFVKVLDTILRNHDKKADHIYGETAHAIIAPHFDSYAISLYKSAAIRKPPTPPLENEDARHLAIELQVLAQHGRYFAQNPGDMRDINRTANGDPVWSAGGYWVHMHPEPLRAVVALIEQHDYTIATYAFCSDHHWDGPNGHSGGKAVDIVAISGVQISSQSATAHERTLAVARLLAAGSGAIDKPRQLICDGYGYMHSNDISSCCVPNAPFYGSATLSEHRNHIHYGI